MWWESEEGVLNGLQFCCIVRGFQMFDRSLSFSCLTGVWFLFGCRNSWWCAGHGLWHFHQDSAEVPASLCAGASWGGHALHRGDSQWYQHHHLWSTATAGRKGQGVYKGDPELSWKLKQYHLQAVCEHSLIGVQLCAGVVQDVKGRLPNTNCQHLQKDFHDF